MRILLVEDEPSIARFVRQGLTEAGYAVDVASDGQEGFDYLLAADYDVLVLDVLLPRLNGLALLRQARHHHITTPALILTARDTVENRVEGLDAGADDYLIKPFAFSELLARVRALLRRPPLQNDTLLQVGDLALNTATRQVSCRGIALDPSPREYAVLEYLLRHPRQVLTRTQIGEHVWNFDFYPESNVVDVYVGYLRRKLEKAGGQTIIETIRGVGYRLTDEATNG